MTALRLVASQDNAPQDNVLRFPVSGPARPPHQPRCGQFRYVRWADVPVFYARGWMAMADLGRTHGQWSVLMWHCERGEILP